MGKHLKITSSITCALSIVMFDYRRVSLSFDWLFSMVSHALWTLGAIQKTPKTTEVNLKEELEESCSFWLDGALNIFQPPEKYPYRGTGPSSYPEKKIKRD